MSKEPAGITDKLKARCNADNQFDNFERLFNTVMSVSKTEMLRREKKEKHRNARKRAKKKEG